MKKIERDTGIQFIPKFVKQTSDLWYGDIVTHENYNAKLNLNTDQGDYNTEFLRLLLTIADGENTPHVPYLDNYINEIIDELDTKTNDKDLATVAKSGSYTDLSDTPTKLSSFENDTNYVNTEELNNNLTNLSRELVMLLQDINKDIDTVENTANSAIDAATYAQNIAISAEEKASTANTNAEEALALAQSYGTAIANKQDQLTAGDNVTIVDNVISSTDTKYTAGANITIDENNVISSTGGGGGGGSYELPIASNNTLGGIKVGANLTITEDGTLNAEAGGSTGGTEYIAGAGIRIEDNVISSKPTYFFTLSQSPGSSFSLDTNVEAAEAFKTIINHYLKYKELPEAYWYLDKEKYGAPDFTVDGLTKLEYIYVSSQNSETTTIQYSFLGVVPKTPMSQATYGIKYNEVTELYGNLKVSTSEFLTGVLTSPLTGTVSASTSINARVTTTTLSRILATNNTATFTPTNNYHPATKKYVDDAVANAGGTEYTAGENILISEDNVISAILKTYENIITEEDGTTTYIQSGDTGAFLRVANATVDPTQRVSIASNSILISDGDNIVALQAHHNYSNTLDSSYVREAQASNGGLSHYLAECLGEEGGPSYSLLDGTTGKSAELTTTDLTLAGTSVMDTLNEKVTNGNTAYPVKVYVQDTQPAAEEGYTVVWINTSV